MNDVDRPMAGVEPLIAVVGIWFVCRHVPEFVSGVYALGLADEQDGAATLLGISVVQLVASGALGACLIVFRKRLAAWLGGGAAGPATTGSALLAVGVALLGVYFAARGAVSVGSYLLVEEGAGARSPYLLRSGLSALAVGVALFAGSTGIARVWAFLRGRGRDGP